MLGPSAELNIVMYSVLGRGVGGKVVGLDSGVGATLQERSLK